VRRVRVDGAGLHGVPGLVGRLVAGVLAATCGRADAQHRGCRRNDDPTHLVNPLESAFLGKRIETWSQIGINEL
jgi:hypothetical protein